MFKKRYDVLSLAFIVVISAYFSFMLNIKFWQFAFQKIEISNFYVAIFVVTLPFFIFVPLFWLFNLIVWPRVGKFLVALLLVLSAVSDYALCNLGVVINSDMIRNFVETNVREARDLITLHAVFYVLIVGVIPAVAVWRANIVFSSFGKEIRRRITCVLLSLAVVGMIAAVSYKEYASFGRNNKDVRYYVNTFNYIYAVGRYYKRNQDAKRKFVVLDSAPKVVTNKPYKPRVMVLIVGETARAKNFSLYGYEKETNPRLSSNNEIVVFKDVMSCGTATAVSLPCMFSDLDRESFDVVDAQYRQNLLDIAKAAGYDVIWKDNDDGCKRVCDRVGMIDAKEGNKQPYCFGDYCQDEVLLDGLEERLSNIHKDTLIVLHTMGSHGPTYYKRYPDRFKKFVPACDTANLQDCTKEQIVNSYNNTIVYTDYIIASVIDILKGHGELQSGMLYVSDHGESLGENNLYLHGLPYRIAPEEQKKVPMILWMSGGLEQNLGVDKACLRQKAESESFSHDNYFHTVLKLLFIKSNAYDAKFDMLVKCSGGGRF